MFLSTINVYAALKQEGNFQYDIKKYENKDGSYKLGVCIDHYTATDSDAILIFPDEIEEYPVIELASGGPGNEEFFTSSKVQDSIKEVTIPASVEIIDGTFGWCKSLEAVYFEGNNLRKIDQFSFAYCRNLSLIDLPSSVEEIGREAFSGCDSIEEFVIPESVKRLDGQPGNNIGFVISGKKLKKIHNSSQLDFSISIALGKSWYYDETGTQKAEIIPAGKTVYWLKLTNGNSHKPSSSNNSDSLDNNGDTKSIKPNLKELMKKNSNNNLLYTPLYNGDWVSIDGRWYLRLDDFSYAKSRWAYIKDKWYLFGTDSVMFTGWQQIGNDWYYLEETGEMVIGWKLINQKWYYMDNTGVMFTNVITPDGYKLNEKGEWIE